MDMGGPRLRPDPGERAERRLFTLDPDLVPLMSFRHDARLSQPRTAFRGASLLTVMHEYFTDRHYLDEWESRQPWSWGSGSIDDEEVAWSRTQVDQVEALQRRLTQSG